MPDTAQAMNYDEREALKAFAQDNQNLQETILMIAHWMRQDTKINFSSYAANWVAGHQTTDVTPMQKEWPLKGARHIKDGGSDWSIDPLVFG